VSDDAARSEGERHEHLLRLYVTGRTPASSRALQNLRRLCEAELGGAYRLEIIDVLEHPQLAEEERILATPALIRRLPLPMRRLVGDLSNTEQVLLGLDLLPVERGPEPEA
jgi:circadian clock protein KaiB